jgi:hypothetical protein
MEVLLSCDELKVRQSNACYSSTHVL